MQKKATLLLGKIQPSAREVESVCKSRLKAQLPEMVHTKLDEVSTLLKSMESSFKMVIDSYDPKFMDYDGAAVIAAVKEAKQICTATLQLYKLCAGKK